MKKIILLTVLNLLLLNAPVAKADTAVQSPATFILKVSEKATVTNYLNMQIELVKIGSVNTQSYPEQTRKNVEISVTSPGGCGTGTGSYIPSRLFDSAPSAAGCLGMPAFESIYSVGEGGSVTALALSIKVTSISSDSATFSVSIGSTVVSPKCTPPPACLNATPRCLIVEPAGGWCANSNIISPPTICQPRPACLDAAPRCMISEPAGGWCSNNTRGIIICPNGLTGSNCSVCSDGGCSTPRTPPVNKPGTIDGVPPADKPGFIDGVPPTDRPGNIGGVPPTLNLPKGYDLISAEKVEANGGAPTYFKVKTEKKARLFFIFPVSPKITYSVSSETGASTVASRPWWNFLAW